MPAKALRGQKLADELLRVAKIFEGKYRQAFLRSVISVVRDQNLIALINDIESGKFTYGDSIDARLASVAISVKEMETLTSKAMVSSAKITNQVMNMEGSFNVVNDAFIEAAKNLSINLSTSVSNSARQSLRGVIEELVSGAIPKSEALRRIMLEVGLLPTHAIAVRNYRATLLGSGTPIPKVKTLTEAYTKRLLKYRADMIARTEVARSIGIGQTEFWKQMQAQGFLPPDANRVWITSIDEKTCEFCGPMNGLVASIGGGWQTSKGYLEYPQASHPHCRCSAGITMSKPKKSQAIYKLEELEWQNWLIGKGESAGHPFRGNQYIRGVGGSRTGKPLRQIKYGKSTPEVLAALALGGGFTFDPKRGQVRAVGVAVAIDKEYEIKVPIEVFKKIGAQIVRDYAQRRIEQLQAPNTHVGAWKSKVKGKEYIYLDTSVLKTTLEEAAELGRANDQIGIYELSTYTTWERIGRGSKYYPVTERKLGGRDIRYPDLTAVGKAQTLRGVTFLTLSDILDNNILDEFVSVLANSEYVEKGESAGHPFRGNQYIRGVGGSSRQETFGDESQVFAGSARIQKSLSPEDIEAVADYTARGYVEINSRLRSIRSTEELTDAQKFSRSILDDRIAVLDTVFEKSAVICKRDMFLHRGTTLLVKKKEFFESWVSKLKTGDVIEDKAFVSTSAEKGTAQSFSNSGSALGVIFTIKVPKGTKVMAGLDSESELILNRGTKMRVVSVTQIARDSTDQRYGVEVELEVIP